MSTPIPVSLLLAGLPNFLIYLVASIVCVVAFVLIYVWITPHRELHLIHQGNIAASLALSGVVLGYAIPLANVVTHAVSLTDLAIWALVAASVQIVGYVLMRLVVKDLSAGITEGRTSLGLAYGVVALALGLLNSACITY